jgi:catalase
MSFVDVLTLTALAPDQVRTQKTLLFNPVSLPAGIAPSADPVLLARFPSYAVSFRQRIRQSLPPHGHSWTS